MKRILLVLALIATFQFAGAQGAKSAAEVKEAIAKAEEATQNPKKAANPATWITLASKYMEAYEAPSGNLMRGTSKQNLALMFKEKPVSTETVTVAGATYTKEVYKNKELYFNANGLLEIIKVTKPYVSNALDKAAKAYYKANEVDAKGKKTKNVVEGLKRIASYYMEDGMLAYTFGDYAEASKCFENAAETLEKEPVAAPDAEAYYNAGFTAGLVKDDERAIKLFDKCLALGYNGEEGAVYAKLAEAYTNLDQKDKAAECLEEGFKLFPQSQSILIGLINYYLNEGKDTGRLFELINAAKANEPNNASLYYVEGNINKELGKIDDAAAAYAKCAEVDPSYEFGYIGIGAMYYDIASELSQKASEELDDRKYEAMLLEVENNLMKAIEPFEKVFEISKNNDIKMTMAEYLKNIYYRLSAKDEKYEAAYNKYNDIMKNGL
ncbi:MAG: tetratricopeptide repeat protein [Candidatus Cryptobacteroides sp.]